MIRLQPSSTVPIYKQIKTLISKGTLTPVAPHHYLSFTKVMMGVLPFD